MEEAITTAEQLLHAGDIGRCELVQGKLVMLDYLGGEQGMIVAAIGAELGAFVRARRLGTVVAETGYVLARDPDTVRAPNVSFLSANRPINRGYTAGAPDLAVEVPSPEERDHVGRKTAEWLAAGARIVWVVDPDARTVTIHEPDKSPRTLTGEDTLDAGAVLPGFELPVARFWE